LSVYVGKDVEITIQAPIEEDVSSQFNGTNLNFTVSKTPISDRDMDGVANESEHVIVKVKKAGESVFYEFEAETVNDASGAVTLKHPQEDQKATAAYGPAPFGTTSDQQRAQTFIPTVPWITGVILRPEPNIGSPTDNVIVELYATDADGKPTGSALASATVSASDWNSHAYQAYQIDFDSPYNGMTVGEKYAIVVRRSGTLDNSNYYVASYGGGYAKGDLITYNGSDWIITAPDTDLYFTTLFSGYPGASDTVKCIYRYDLNPYVAQEITIEPKQRIEGLDGLGSDTVQLWAPLLKEIDGSIKEVYKPGDEHQLSRVETFADSPSEVYWGIIVSWSQSSSTVKIGLNNAVFPEGSLPAPKNEPVYIVTPFKAQSIKVIT